MKPLMMLKITGFLCVLSICLYFFAQWKLTSTLDQLIINSSKDIEISYSSARVTLAGSALIHDSNVYIPSLNIHVDIDEVEFSSSSIIDILFASDSSGKFTLPDHLAVRFEDANLALSTRLVAMIKSVEQPSNISALEASGCGQKTHIGIHEYLAMGYKSINFSGYSTLDKTAEIGGFVSRMSGVTYLEIANMTRFEYKIELSNVLNSFDDFSQFKLLPTIDFIALDITDLGYNFRKNTYCAQQENTLIAGYIDNHIKLVSEALKSAELDMSDNIKRTYRELLQPGSKVHLSFSPKAGLNMDSLFYYNEQELREVLGIEIKINNFDLAPIFDGWQLNKFKEVVALSPKQITLNNRIKTYDYYLKPLVNAKRYINKKVKIVKHNGVILEGFLASVNKESLRLKISYQAGKSEGEIGKDKITSFYVYQ